MDFNVDFNDIRDNVDFNDIHLSISYTIFITQLVSLLAF